MYMCYIVQMVMLYKDPEGATVFTAHEAAMQVTILTALPDPPSTHSQEVNGLRRRIKQLEEDILEYKVL